LRNFLEVAGFALGATALYALGLLVLGVVAAGIGQMLYTIRRHRSRPAGHSDFKRLLGRMKRAETTTLLLTPAKSPGFSKLGGDPELPEGVEWPIGDGRGVYAFATQIDLGAFRAHGGPEWLPLEGRLYAFVDVDRYGGDDQVLVIYTTEAVGPGRNAPPKVRGFPERRVAFEAYASVPSLDWLGLENLNVSDAELDVLSGLPDEPFGDEIQHRIGGYPNEIQGGRLHVECELLRRGLPEGAEVTDAILRAARQWRLLLQVDSDSALKMNWGDGGRLYVFIREADARKGDFSKTVTLTQCY
jgi:uncharacterized protein YwqG